MGEAGSELALGQVQDREDGKTLLVTELWLKGFSFRKISDETGINRDKVRKLIQKAKAVWTSRKELALTDAIAEQLRRVDLIETSAWEAWERSAKEYSETKVQQTKDGTFKTRTIKTGIGDPRFLDTALKCIEQRCKLLGVYKPPEERAEMQVWGVMVVVDNPEQAEEILAYEQFKSMAIEAESVHPTTNEISPLTGSENSESND